MAASRRGAHSFLLWGAVMMCLAGALPATLMRVSVRAFSLGAASDYSAPQPPSSFSSLPTWPSGSDTVYGV